YTETFVDGVSMGAHIVSEEVITEVANGVLLVGADVPASPLVPENEIEFDENGNPVNYKQVFRKQVATAYSAKPGSKGASGLPAKIGYVAVRAAMIPYGSELYIKTADGSFVYGYCIAGDTGVGLLQNVIDVDVFFDTYLESCLFGRKTVDIYVLN
ncbi:MAG: 3D domain-containing protein, partial [Oscillospiraceae bacterium]|nr:3D domain-containing protein [Oscillospiraceae bacterium]